MSSTIPPIAANTALQTSAPLEATSTEQLHETGASFHGLCRAEQLKSYGSFDERVLPVPDEELIGNALRHWKIAERVYFFDLLALEILQGLGNAQHELTNEFIDLYRECMVCAEFENLKLEKFCFENNKPKFAAFKSNMLRALFKSLGSDRSPDRINEIKRLEQTLALLIKYLENPLARKLLTSRSLFFYYERSPIGAFSKDQQAIYLNFLRVLNPREHLELDPEAFLSIPPSQFYRRIAASNDRIHAATREIALRVKERGGRWSKEDAIKVGSLNLSVRRIAGLKQHFEEEFLRKNRALIESRGMESLKLYSHLRCFSKGFVQGPFDEILKKIEAALGPDFDGVLDRILEKGKLDPWMRDLSCFDRLRPIMSLVKREIRSLHAEASAGKFGDPREIDADYRDCFDTLSTLFVALHDMVATQNANYDQLQERQLPEDLVSCAVLAPYDSGSSPADTPAPSLEDLDEPAADKDLPPSSPAPQNQQASAASTALLPAVDVDLPPPSPAPKDQQASAASTALLPTTEETLEIASPRQMQAPPAFRRQMSDPYERKERGPSPSSLSEINIPKTGAKPGKVGQFLLSQGFHLSSVTDHRYYCHSGIRVKVSSHDTLSPGVRQEIIRALQKLSEMGALE